MIGVGALVTHLGPAGVRAEVCQGYVEDVKSLKLSREEKESYLDKFKNETSPQTSRSSQMALKNFVAGSHATGTLQTVVAAERAGSVRHKKKKSASKNVAVASNEKKDKSRFRSLSSSARVK